MMKNTLIATAAGLPLEAIIGIVAGVIALLVVVVIIVTAVRSDKNKHAKSDEIDYSSVLPEELPKQEPEAQPAKEEAAQPVEPVAEEAAQPEEPVAEEAAQPVEPVAEEAAQPVDEPRAEAAAQPLGPQAEEPAQPPVEPVAEEAAQPVEEPVAEEAAQPEEPVAEEPAQPEAPATEPAEVEAEDEVVLDAVPVDEPEEDIVESEPVAEKQAEAGVVYANAHAVDEPADAAADRGMVILGDKRVYVTYNRSFESKIIQGSDVLKSRYSVIKNKLLAYKKMKSRMSWSNETFRAGRPAFAKLAVRGRTISLYLALPTAEYADTKYRFEDVSDVKKYEQTPMRLKLRSDRSVKYACELISAAAERAGLAAEDKPETDYAPAYESTEALIDRGLIKLLATGDEGTEAVLADFAALSREKFRRVGFVAIKDRVSVSEAKREMTDEVAASMLEMDSEPVAARPQTSGKKGIINIDTLSANFAAGDLVTLDKLKEKGLAPRNIGQLKVLARGVLDKPLTVEAQDFSLDAVKMIVLTGGHAKRI